MAQITGSIQPFSLDDDWQRYIEQVDMFFLGNLINDEARKAALLLAALVQQLTNGSVTYAFLIGLPLKRTTQLKTLMTTHLCPAPLEVMERSRFDYRIQGPTETISEYNVALHAMALHCNFADTLTTCLRDRLVSGLRSEIIRKSLYTKKELTYKDALDTALAIELASKEATPSTPSNVSTHYSGSKATPQPQLQQQSHNGRRHLNTTTITRTKSLTLPVSIGGISLAMEIDTGAAATIISKQCFDKYFTSFKLQPTAITMSAYDGHSLSVEGICMVPVTLRGRTLTLPLCVVTSGAVPLLGRDWLLHFGLLAEFAAYANINSVQQVAAVPDAATDATLEQLLTKHAHVFRDE
uniref:Peptidase A2 domain-containing protein n=1 Tax=Strigamia maritima TaxID=126957 RepID=T1IM27_STRMM